MVIFRKRCICNNFLDSLIHIPPWYENWRKPTIYDLKHALRAKYEKLHRELIHLGFTLRKCNHSHFIYNHQNIILYDLMYVDDILLTRSSSTLLYDLISKLHGKFVLKNLWVPQYFISIKVHYQENRYMVLAQTKYINLLFKVNMGEKMLWVL